MKLLALPFAAFVLIAAQPAPPAQPALPINAPAEVAADPANRLTLQLSNGGTVVILLRPDAAPLWLGHGTEDAVVHAEDTTILCERQRAAGGRCEAKLYPGLSHPDTLAVFSPLFRKKAPVLDDATAFLRRQLG